MYAKKELRIDQVGGGNPLRLWVVSYLFAPVWAGPAERFLRYGKGMAERGVEMTVVTPMRPDQPRTEVTRGVRVERIGGSETVVESIDRFLGRASLRAISARPRPDVVVLLAVGPLLLPFLWLLKIAGIKTIHVSTMARLDAGARPSPRKWILDRCKWAIYSGFDSIVCSANTSVSDFTELGIRPSKVAVIPNGVSLPRFSPTRNRAEKESLRDRLRLPPGDPIALFVGLRVERKGVLELVDAWRRYRTRGGSGWLVLVGQEQRDVPEFGEFYRRWDRCIAKIEPADHIEIRPAHVQAEDYFRACDLFVFLSSLEGMPNVIPEAMACGCPVLTTSFKGFSTDLGRDGRELVITDRDPSQVCDHIDRMLNDSEFRGTIAANALRWVEERQDLEHVLDRYVDLFTSDMAK